MFIKSSKFTDDSWSGELELLEQAFRLDPNNLHVFEEVAKLARVTGKVPNEVLMKQLQTTWPKVALPSITTCGSRNTI